MDRESPSRTSREWQPAVTSQFEFELPAAGATTLSLGDEINMTTYSQMIRWMIGRGHHDVVRSMIVESMGMRSQLPHPDPIEANARTHERTAIVIMLDCVGDHLLEEARGGVPNEMWRGLFDAWMSIDCPGLVDQAVVNQLRLNGMSDEVRLASLIPNSMKSNTEHVVGGNGG